MTSAPAWAADYWSPRTMALGGAGHAGPMLNDAIYLNPSFAAFLPTYGLSFNYTWFNGNQQPDGSYSLHGHPTNLSIQDGTSQLFQAGVGLTLKDGGKLLNVGAAKAVIKQLGFGLGGKFYFPNLPTQASNRDLTFSTTYSPFAWLQAAFIADNLFETPAGQALGNYREFVLGMKFNLEKIVLVYFDPHLAPDVPNQSSFGEETGVEFTVMQDFFLRLGMFHNSNVPYLQDVRGRGYGAGVGWIAPKVSLDFGLSHLIDPASALAYNLGFTVFF